MDRGFALVRRHGDVLWAVLLAGVIAAEIVAFAEDDLTRSILCGLLTTLPLGWRRRSPLLAFVLTMTGIELLTQVQPGFDNDSSVFVIAFIHALYSLGRHARGIETYVGAVGLLVVMVLFAQDEGGVTQADPGDVAYLLGFVGAPWAAGLTIRLRREREAVLNAENARLGAEQEERAQRAVAEERARIARELHDVVSHAISVTVLQARGARRTLGIDDEQVRLALDAIEQTNTAALSDMRRLLAVLRDTEPTGGEGGDDDHAPQPTLAHLDQLVARVHASGLPVSLDVVGRPGSVPPGVDLSAYRIVQEALTNVLKHSTGASARITLAYDDDALGITVTDDGNARINGSSRTGQGLIGIRERVAVVGGEITAEPLPDGGFRVHARLPYSVETS